MKKAIIRLFTILVILVFIPTMTFADSAERVDYSYFDDYIIGIGFDEITPNHLSGNGWEYNPDTLTLTINNYVCTNETPHPIEGTYDGYWANFASRDGIYIYSYNKKLDFNIVIIGKNKIYPGADDSCVIEADCCDVKISGNGTLEGISNALGNAEDTSAIWVEKGNLEIGGSVFLDLRTSKYKNGEDKTILCSSNILITDNAKVNCIAGRRSSYSSGIYAEGILTINDNAVVDSSSGIVTKEGGKSVALFSKKGTRIKDNARVTVHSGTAKNMSTGVASDKNIFIQGGKVSAKASKVTGKSTKKNSGVESSAIIADKDISIANAEIIAESDNSTDSDAILSTGGSITIINSDVRAIGGKASGKKSTWKNAGLHANNKCIIENSNISASSLASKRAYGIFAKNSRISITGISNVTALGKIAFNKKPIFLNSKAVIFAGESDMSATCVARSSKRTYTKHKYVNVTTTEK